MDSYYPEALKDINLYDFIAWHDVVTEWPNNENITFYKFPFGYLKKRTKSYLINHYCYSVHDSPQSYFYTILLLFKPWRLTDELLPEGCSSYVAAEDQNVLEIEGPDNLVHFVPRQAAEVMAEFRDVAAQPVLEDAQDMIKCLNKEQKKVFYHIANTLQSSRQLNPEKGSFALDTYLVTYAILTGLIESQLISIGC
ncbi:UNVERIFIED_CONTAM: hypothetical protein FKN15_007693 [Acipenser sinensis]